MSTYAETRNALSALVSEADVKGAIDAGALRESHHLDLKREPWPSANDEMLKDIGAMAFDGGFLVVGVDEGPPVDVSAFPLKGVRERIVQASQKLSPPLKISTSEIPSKTVGNGFVIVDVPPSLALIHYLNSGRVPWREDTTTRWLTAGEVQSLDARRAEAEDDVRDLLHQMVRPPNPSTVAQDGVSMTVRLIARPVFPTRRLLTGYLQDDPHNLTSTGYLWRVLLAAKQAERLAQDNIGASDQMSFGALFEGTPHLAPTESGVAIESGNALAGLVRADIEADATTSIFVENIGEIIRYDDGAAVGTFNDRALILLLRQLTRTVRQIIADTGYRGPWWFGISTNGFQRATAHSRQHSVTDPLRRTNPVGVPVTHNDYQRVVTVSTTRVEEDAGALTEELIGDLLHQFGCKPRWKSGGYLA
jgi:hypothetical protein